MNRSGGGFHVPLVKNVSVAKSVLKIASGLPSGPSQKLAAPSPPSFSLSALVSRRSSSSRWLSSVPPCSSSCAGPWMVGPACTALRFEHIRTTLVFHGPAHLFFQRINASSPSVRRLFNFCQFGQEAKSGCFKGKERFLSVC